MPARTGKEYIARLKEQGPQVYLHGDRVKDVTAHPALRNGVGTLAHLYDIQHDTALRDEMTYVSPTTGDRVGVAACPETRCPPSCPTHGPFHLRGWSSLGTLRSMVSSAAMRL